jgi:hypothetical protein
LNKRSREMICGRQVTIPQPPLCIKQMSFNAKISFDVTSKNIFALKLTYVTKRGGKGTVSRPLDIRAQRSKMTVWKNISKRKR